MHCGGKEGLVKMGMAARVVGEDTEQVFERRAEPGICRETRCLQREKGGRVYHGNV